MRKKITNVTKNRVDDRAVLEGDSFGLDHSLRSRGFFLNRRCRNVALGLRRHRRRRRGRVESILDESNRTPTSPFANFSELENLEKIGISCLKAQKKLNGRVKELFLDIENSFITPYLFCIKASKTRKY